jgi:hypothetical protein
MKPLAAALADAPSPFPAIQWLKESPNTKLLAQLATEGHTLSHELLDELPPSRNQRYIRQLLIHTGVLEERHEDIERIPGWLEHELEDKPATHANFARPFLHCEPGLRPPGVTSSRGGGGNASRIAGS